MTLAPGTDLGPYRIEAPIGAGGMGAVWKARDTRLDRTVAVKTIERRFNERFESEAKTIASLNHPHICTLHDVGEKLSTHPYMQIQGQFSPDGRWIAYMSDESGSRQVYVISYPPGAGKLTISSKGGSQPRWRGDGRELFYVSGGKLTAVPIRSIGKSLQVGAPQELFDFPAADTNSRHRYDAAADGQRFLVLADPPDRKREPITVVLNWAAGLVATRAPVP